MSPTEVTVNNFYIEHNFHNSEEFLSSFFEYGLISKVQCYF